jgi:uncharacterized protein (UPF0371 family)
LRPAPLTCFPLRPHFRPRKPPGVQSLRLLAAPSGEVTATPIYNAGYQLCIYAGDIERRRIRGDFGITYDSDALKMIDDLGRWNITVKAVVITRFEGQESTQKFKNRLERRGVKVYTHRFTKGYPTDVDTIVSDQGYGANEYIPTDKQIVVVTGPGPNSGKLATCLSQLYHEHKRGVQAGYAKFETFPIWNLPLTHPVNVAYEAATADIGDSQVRRPCLLVNDCLYSLLHHSWWASRADRLIPSWGTHCLQ